MFSKIETFHCTFSPSLCIYLFSFARVFPRPSLASFAICLLFCVVLFIRFFCPLYLSLLASLLFFEVISFGPYPSILFCSQSFLSRMISIIQTKSYCFERHCVPNQMLPTLSKFLLSVKTNFSAVESPFFFSGSLRFARDTPLHLSH